MTTLHWCKKQKQGIEIISPNDNLAEEYYQNAEETLRVINLIKNSGSNMWLATQKYYAEYLAAYAILMKIGVKSEIHTCTIVLIEFLEKQNIIPFSFSKQLTDDKQLRIDNQYYLKNRPVPIDGKSLAHLLLTVRNVLDTLSQEKISEIREIIKNGCN